MVAPPLSWHTLSSSPSHSLIHVSHSAGVSVCAVCPVALSYKDPDAIELAVGPEIDAETAQELLGDLYLWSADKQTSYRDSPSVDWRSAGQVIAQLEAEIATGTEAA